MLQFLAVKTAILLARLFTRRKSYDSLYTRLLMFTMKALIDVLVHSKAVQWDWDLGFVQMIGFSTNQAFLLCLYITSLWH